MKDVDLPYRLRLGQWKLIARQPDIYEWYNSE